MIGDKKKWVRRGIIFLLVVFVAGCGEQRFGAKEAPDFTLPSLVSAEELSLHDYSGQVVYLSFWASWCLPCRQEMPYLTQLWQRHRDSGLQVNRY